MCGYGPGLGYGGAYATAGVGGGYSWFGIGAVIVGTLILIAILAVFVTLF